MIKRPLFLLTALAFGACNSPSQKIIQISVGPAANSLCAKSLSQKIGNELEAMPEAPRKELLKKFTEKVSLIYFAPENVVAVKTGMIHQLELQSGITQDSTRTPIISRKDIIFESQNTQFMSGTASDSVAKYQWRNNDPKTRVIEVSLNVIRDIRQMIQRRTSNLNAYVDFLNSGKGSADLPFLPTFQDLESYINESECINENISLQELVAFLNE